MKKQGSVYLKVILGVLGLTLVSWLVLRALVPQSRSIHTQTAVSYEVGDGLSTTGFIVRSETLLEQSGEAYALERGEGEWVGAGQPVATTYLSQDAQGRQARIDSLQQELSRLQYAYTYCTSNADGATLDADIQSRLLETSMYISQRNTHNLTGAADKLKTLILRRYTDAEDAVRLWQRITQLTQEISGLEEATEVGTNSLMAPVAGYFSANLDGYEKLLSPESMESLRPADFDRLMELEPKPAGGALCKLITSNTWYYLTVVDATLVSNYEVGDRLNVRFAHRLNDEMSMLISYKKAEEDGRCVLALQADTFVFDTYAMRKQAADIVFHTYRGLRVPKQALYFIDEKPGVYVLEAACAEWKTVKIIHDNEDSYIVELDKSDTDNLWPGDEIIVTDEPLYDGKVVAP